MRRLISDYIRKDLNKKIILLSGPRQCGKTTISKQLSNSFSYLNYDILEHRKMFIEKSWDRAKELLVLDELHKMKNWKGWLKGVYDLEGIEPKIIVTGSAKLDTFKKVGDSLAGRYFGYRLHPLDVREINSITSESPVEVMDKLLEVGGFPEPYLEGEISFYNKWKRTHLDIILRQDLIDIANIRDIVAVETLIELLKDLVGSHISYQSLAEDLQYSDKTIKHWLQVLENSYVIFKLLPFSKNIAKSKLKSPKYYFYDNGQVRGDEGAKLENLVACSLLKECHYRADCLGENYELYYLGTSRGEIDFCITKDRVPTHMIEVKLSDDSLSKNFNLFSKYYPNAKKVQLVKNIKLEKTYPDGSEIREVSNWLTKW